MIKFFLTSFIFFPLIFTAQNSWTKKSSLPASKRVRSVAFSIGGHGYLCCGEDSNSIELNDCWEYDPGSDSWTQKASIPASGRRDAVGFSIGMKGYVGTGIDNANAQFGNILYDFWEYSPVTNVWTPKANYPGGLGNGVYSAAAFATSVKGYVCCGKMGPANYASDLWEFNPANNSWSQKTGFPGGPRLGQMSFSLNGKGYVGCGTDPNWFCGDFYEYDPAIDFWTQKADFPASQRAFGTAFSIGQKGYMGMGEDGGYCNDMYVYDPPSDSWNIIAPFASEGRRSAPAFVIAGAAYVMTGKGVSGKHRDMWQYMPYVTGLAEFGEAGMSVYPNPATDVLKFDISGNFSETHDGLKITMMDVEGKIIDETFIAGKTHVELKNENWAKGTYLINLSDNSTSFGTTKIIVN